MLEIGDSEFLERDILLTYNLSMMTVVDEINTDRTQHMQYPEFMEAICRAS